MRGSIPRQVDKKSSFPKEERGVWGSQRRDRCLEFSRRRKDKKFSTFLSLSHIKCFFFFKPGAVDYTTKQFSLNSVQFSSVQSLSHVRLFVTPWTAAQQASLSITNSWNLLKLMSIKSVMPSSHLILCCPLLLLPSIFPRIRVFSNESALRIRWPKYWSFSFSISPSNEYSGLISFRIDWFNLRII